MLATQSQATGTVTWLQDSPGGNGKWISFSNAIGTVRSVELDPLLNDVGVENPSVTGGVGGDGSSYPGYGDPVGPQTCALNDDVLPCDYVMKVLGRDRAQLIFATIAARIGAPINSRNIVAESQPGSNLKDVDPNYSIDEKTGKMITGPSVTVAPEPEVLTTIESTSANILWVNMRTLTYLSPAAQGPKLVGRLIPLKRNQIEAVRQELVDALKDLPDCKKFVSDWLGEMGRLSNVKPFSTNPVQIFNRLASLGHVFRTSRDSHALAWGGGSAGSGSGSIIFDYPNIAKFQSLYIPAFLHELAHAAPSRDFAGGYSHQLMDQAAYNILSKNDPTVGRIEQSESGQAHHGPRPRQWAKL